MLNEAKAEVERLKAEALLVYTPDGGAVAFATPEAVTEFRKECARDLKSIRARLAAYEQAKGEIPPMPELTGNRSQDVVGMAAHAGTLRNMLASAKADAARAQSETCHQHQREARAEEREQIARFLADPNSKGHDQLIYEQRAGRWTIRAVSLHAALEKEFTHD
jgi:hypothetical protein